MVGSGIPSARLKRSPETRYWKWWRICSTRVKGIRVKGALVCMCGRGRSWDWLACPGNGQTELIQCLTGLCTPSQENSPERARHHWMGVQDAGRGLCAIPGGPVRFRMCCEGGSGGRRSWGTSTSRVFLRGNSGQTAEPAVCTGAAEVQREIRQHSGPGGGALRGNIQKLIVARGDRASVKFLIAAEPTEAWTSEPRVYPRPAG